MKADRIHISDFAFLSIEQLEIDQQIGQHATGVIAGFSFEREPHDMRMQLILKSGTYQMDRVPHFRSPGQE